MRERRNLEGKKKSEGMEETWGQRSNLKGWKKPGDKEEI